MTVAFFRCSWGPIEWWPNSCWTIRYNIFKCGELYESRYQSYYSWQKLKHYYFNVGNLGVLGIKLIIVIINCGSYFQNKYPLPWPLYMLLVAAHCHCEFKKKNNNNIYIKWEKGFNIDKRQRRAVIYLIIQTSAFHTTSVLHMTAHTQQMWTFSSDFL